MIPRYPPSVTGWTAYTPTITGFGTVSDVNFVYRRVGENIEVLGSWVNGTVAASAATVSLPSGLTIDSTKLPGANRANLGTYHTKDNVAGNVPDNGNGPFVVTNNTGVSSTTVAIASNIDYSASGLYVPENGNAFSASSNGNSIIFKVPISGWIA